MKDGYTNEDLLLVWLAACAGLDERAKNEIAQVCARGISAKHLEKNLRRGDTNGDKPCI